MEKALNSARKSQSGTPRVGDSFSEASSKMPLLYLKAGFNPTVTRFEAKVIDFDDLWPPGAWRLEGQPIIVSELSYSLFHIFIAGLKALGEITPGERTKKPSLPKVPEDLSVFLLAPSVAAAVIKKVHGKTISPRMMSHVVKTTIGETHKPAVGQGTKSMFDFYDLILTIKGLQFLDLGLPPHYVRTCMRAIRKETHKILTVELLDAIVKEPQEKK